MVTIADGIGEDVFLGRWCDGLCHDNWGDKKYARSSESITEAAGQGGDAPRTTLPQAAIGNTARALFRLPKRLQIPPQYARQEGRGRAATARRRGNSARLACDDPAGKVPLDENRPRRVRRASWLRMIGLLSRKLSWCGPAPHVIGTEGITESDVLTENQAPRKVNGIHDFLGCVARHRICPRRTA